MVKSLILLILYAMIPLRTDFEVNIESYRHDFIEDLQKRGLKLKLNDKLRFQIVSKAYIEQYEKGVIGYCDLPNRRILFLKGILNKYVFYHEMGHTILGRWHSFNQASLMWYAEEHRTTPTETQLDLFVREIKVKLKLPQRR